MLPAIQGDHHTCRPQETHRIGVPLGAPSGAGRPAAGLATVGV